MRKPTGLPADVFVMSGVALCVALGFGIVAPAIPLFAREFGVSATAAGAVVSAFALMRFVSGLGGGWLVNRIGERTGLILGLVVVGVSSLLAGLAQSYPQLLVLRGIGGIGSAVFGVGAMGLVLRVAGRHVRGRAVSIYRSGFLIGGIIGPALGGAVLGISLRAPFFLYAGTLAAAAAVAAVFLSRSTTAQPTLEENGGGGVAEPSGRQDSLAGQDPPAGPESSGRQADSDGQGEVSGQGDLGGESPKVVQLLRTAEYQAALTANFAVGLVMLGVRSTAVPFLLVYSLDAEAGWVGVAFAIAAVVQAALMFPAGRLADTAGRRVALLTGAGVTAAGLVALAFGGSLVVALIAMGVFGAGAAFLGSAPGALVGDVAGKRSGTVVAVFNMANDLGAMSGPLIVGVLVDAGSYAGAFGVGAVVVLVAGVLALRLRRPQQATS